MLSLLTLNWSGALQGAPSLHKFVKALGRLNLPEVALIGYGVLICSFVALPAGIVFVRLLEGYWGSGIARPIAQWRRRHYRDQVSNLRRKVGKGASGGEDEEQVLAAWQLNHWYPPSPDRVMPTRLGNALRAAEDRAGQRYGLETTIVWPRLFPLLPDKVTAIVSDERNQLDLSVRLCLVFAFTALAYFAVLGWPLYTQSILHRWQWLSIPIASAILSWISYRGSINAAISYGIGIASAFDLHRFDLTGTLHLQQPLTLDDEQHANRIISKFFEHGAAALGAGGTIRYNHPELDTKRDDL